MPSASLATASILLVDDSAFSLQTIGFALRRAGHTVREASSAEAALANLDCHGAPRICLVDHIMAGLDGASLIRLMRQRADAADVAMVLMSTAEPEHVRAQARDIGAHAWLAKPFAPEQLLAIISILLDR